VQRNGSSEHAQFDTTLHKSSASDKKEDRNTNVNDSEPSANNNIQKLEEVESTEAQDLLSLPQTTWKSWPKDLDFPCDEAEINWKDNAVQRSPADTGLLFVREMKTGSSTVSGILLRLAHTKGELIRSDKGPCRIRIDHASALELQYGKRDKKRSFLMSLLRDPTNRAISHYFHFFVSKNKENPTDYNFQHVFLNQPRIHNYYTKDLTTEPIDLDKGDHSKIISNILSEYDFLAITERMDESLVVFKMLLGLDFEDILYISTRSNGSFTPGNNRKNNSPCIYIVPSFLTDGMKKFFASDKWQKDLMSADNLLYKAAVRSLDNTIDALGRGEVERQVKMFQKALDYANTRCAKQTVSCCNAKGEYIHNTTCYLWDIGCDHNCLREISLVEETDTLDS